MQLHELRSPVGSRKRRKIVGRGQGSGHGKTSCRGHKGQNSRAGRGILNSLEGGQMPLIRRIAKVGFNSRRPVTYQLVSLDALSAIRESQTVTVDVLKKHRLIDSLHRPVKILGDGNLTKPLTVQAHKFTKSAQDKIISAGGKFQVIEKSSSNGNVTK